MIDSSRVRVGGGLGESFVANTIAHNAGAGVHVTGTTSDGVTINNNRIHSNGGPEIDLGGDGVTPNDPGDADAGPNRLLNHPIITEVAAVPETTLPARSVVRFTLHAEPLRPYAVHLYSTPQPDPSGHGGASNFIGLVRVTTDAGGNAAGVAYVAPVAPGQYVSPLATEDLNERTSEFGPAVRAALPEVYGRFAFYNGSAYDGFDPAADPRDDAAIAPDRYPAFAPGDAAFANVTSYVRGLNGIMIDVAKLPAGAVPTADDFLFRRGPGDGAGAWTDAPEPSSVIVRRGEGIGGSDRVTLVWPDAGTGAAVKNQWLQVTVKPTADTGLSRPDVFYFGNLAGATPSFAPWRVDALDLVLTRRLLHTRHPAVAPAYDFNGDRVVNGRDLAIVRSNFGNRLPALTEAPAVTAAPASLPGAQDVLGETADAVRRRRRYLP